MQTSEDARLSRIFFLLLFGYFTVQTVLRTVLGGTFEFDEAEMFVLAQDYRLGYGPQTPLYNWLQALTFDLFGTTTFAIALPKNILLFLTYALSFDGFRRLLPVRIAIAVTLALLLLPNVSWEGQRAGSHSIAMLALIGATLNVMARRIAAAKNGDHRLSHALLLGVALGLGGITKYNFWLFPLPLLLTAGWFPEIRQALWRRDLWLTLLVAVALLALPMGWAVTHLGMTTAASDTLYHPPTFEGLPPPLLGLTTMLAETLAGLALLLLTLVALRLPYGRRLFALGRLPTLSRWMLASGALGLVVIALPVVGFGVTDVQARWLIPLLIPLAFGLMLWVAPTLTPRLLRNFFRFCALLALLIIIAIADTRLRGAGSDSLDIESLAEAIEQDLPEGATPPAVVSFNFYYPGNLKYLRPSWTALPSHPGGTIPDDLERIVVIGITDPDRIMGKLTTHGLIPAVSEPGPLSVATLPYRFEDVKTRDVPYVIIPLQNNQ
ncbi:ArnT family glycosyltransferase [Celeribacter ethanolicus]|uniref:ArnT family glycosyltransferase n=1 Tax=Celeribacter ethanolicus TaxID=1758178 RepID=UPI000833F42E|nr:glycosyltransferase family 39 protein [Celeribacter ethanolicus]